MPFVDLVTAKQDLRVNHAGDDALITRLVNTAERQVVHFLGREVYATQEALNAAVAAAPATFATAESAYSLALDAADLHESATLKAMAQTQAADDYVRAQHAYMATVNGVVVDDTIKTATMLVVADLYEHRGDEDRAIVGIPMAAETFLWPYRRSFGV